MLKLSHTLSILALVLAFGGHAFALEADGEHAGETVEGKEIKNDTSKALQGKSALPITDALNSSRALEIKAAPRPTILKTSKLATLIDSSDLVVNEQVPARVNLLAGVVTKMDTDITRSNKPVTVLEQRCVRELARFTSLFSASELSTVNADHLSTNLESYNGIFDDGDAKAANNYGGVVAEAVKYKQSHPSANVAESFDGGFINFAKAKGMDDSSARNLDKQMDENFCFN